MKFRTSTIRAKTRILPSSILGATLYLVVGRFGDANPDHAIAIESPPTTGTSVKDGVEALEPGTIQFAPEDFEHPEDLTGPRSAVILLNLVGGKVQVVKEVEKVVVEEREEEFAEARAAEA